MTIRKLLIANRAEISIRIARAAAELGIATVSIYPADDRGSSHLAAADAAVLIEGVGAAAYLDGAAVLRAAHDSGCDAVHPGYGFLSENAEFARACTDAGLIFVGPGPDLIGLFGDKVRARHLAGQCDVPVPAGLAGPVTLGEAQGFLAELPAGGAMMVKAISGGGGRGIRIVRREEDLPEAFERCRSEANAAAGQDGLYVEEFVENARHIEIQIVGDGQGDVRHLWERECSLQRRQQKVVEVAPSPSLPATLRDSIAEAALRMAQHTGYASLGTFEFLVRRAPTPDQAPFVFIECNPRLQVEHTVTEEVTRVDLVKAQLKIAGGASLEAAGLMSVLAPRGYALQARVTMERFAPDGTMSPASGTITAFDMPAGPGVRVDTFGAVGYGTSTLYDSLLAKIIVQADADFGTVVAKARRALRDMRVEGVATNRNLLLSLLSDPQVEANDVDTTFLEVNLGRLAQEADRFSQSSGEAATAAPGPLPVRDTELGVTPTGSEPVVSPLSGRIAAIEVQDGEEVRLGQTLAVVEAMKMETPVVSRLAGIVAGLAVVAGDIVASGDPLVFVRPTGDVDQPDDSAAEHVDPDHVRADLARVLDRQSRIRDAGRPAPVARRHARGHRTSRENVADLCDAGSFVEYGAFVLPVQRARFTRDELIEKGPADGLVAGIGRVNGTMVSDESARVAVMAYDYTAFAGTQGIMAHKKKDRLLELAERSALPVIVFAEGGGGRPGDGDAVDMTGVSSRTFWRFARLNGRVPLIAIVSGRCFAGNAAMAGCCDVIIATRNTTIGMAGPAMIEGGGLGSVSADEVGPISVQAPNGVVDVVVEDEAAAVAVAKRYLAFTQGPTADWTCADQRGLRTAIPENRRRVYDIRALIDILTDGESVLELRRAFAPGLVTCFARIEGRAVGLLANDPGYLGGAIDSDGADKASRFMRLCETYGLPILSLCDTPGFMVGPEAEKTAAVRHMSRMFLAGAGLSVPYLTVVLRKAYGLGAMAMAAGSTSAPLLSVAWPTGEFGGMGPEGAVHLAYRRELAALEGAQRQSLFDRLVAQIYERGSAIEVAGNFEIDAVIDPADTRAWIVSTLRSTPGSTGREPRRLSVDAW